MAMLTAGRVAAAVRTGAEAALQDAGLTDRVSFEGIDGFEGIGRDGLNIVLEGPASAEEAALDAVRALSEIDQVTYRATDDDGAQPQSEAEPTGGETAQPERASAPVAGLDATTVTAAARGASIDLEGTVPDEATRNALITGAVHEYGAANVTHDLVIDAERVTLHGGTLVLNGQAISSDERSGWVTRSSAVANAAGLQFVDRSSVKTVDQALNELFTLEPIEFDVNQATIRSRSGPTLTAAAELINDNPDVGRLRVIGHTDSDGSAGVNQQLSEARAQAVVDHLIAIGDVDADRLEAEGRGESELLVDPEVTPEDKQRNRRIEWEMIP